MFLIAFIIYVFLFRMSEAVSPGLAPSEPSVELSGHSHYSTCKLPTGNNGTVGSGGSAEVRTTARMTSSRGAPGGRNWSRR